MRITICANLVLCFAGKSVYKRERDRERWNEWIYKELKRERERDRQRKVERMNLQGIEERERGRNRVCKSGIEWVCVFKIATVRVWGIDSTSNAWCDEDKRK